MQRAIGYLKIVFFYHPIDQIYQNILLNARMRSRYFAFASILDCFVYVRLCQFYIFPQYGKKCWGHNPPRVTAAKFLCLHTDNKRFIWNYNIGALLEISSAITYENI